jgi:hypothetical protein
MDGATSRIWRSLRPPSAQAVEDARSSQLASLYQPQAVLEGSGTFVIDSAGPLTTLSTELDGPPDVLYTDLLPEEVVERPGHEKWFTVVDGRGRVRWTMNRDGGFDLLVLVARATPVGVNCVVAAAGGGLNGALLRAGLVDEIQLLVLPAAIGGQGTPTLFDGPELADGESPTRLRLLSAHAESDGMLWLRYEVLREAASE